MPSLNTYYLTWVSLTLDEGYLLTAAPPDLEHGVAPLSPPAPAQLPLLGCGVGLKLNVHKTKIMASSPITSWQTDGETMKTVKDFIFGGSKITVDGDCSLKIKRFLLLGRKAMSNLDSILKSRELHCQQRSVYSKLWFFQ